MNQYRPVTMIARTTPGTHNPRISAQTVTLRLREICEITPYTMYVLYAAFHFWPSIYAYADDDTLFVLAFKLIKVYFQHNFYSVFIETNSTFVCSFDLILYVPSTIFQL